MVISITSGRPSPDRHAQVEAFLETFLPKMRQLPGVAGIYHYVRPEKGDDFTVVLWESEEALKRYRESDLFKEVTAFEKQMNMPGTREAYPLTIAL